VEHACDEARQWHERAAKALERGDEATARAALEPKMAADERASQRAKDRPDGLVWFWIGSYAEYDPMINRSASV
jgi:hypothetical protein